MADPLSSEDSEFVKHELHVEADEAAVDATAYVFEFNDETVPVLVVGDIEQADKPLTRVHSRCIYGQVFGSQECDCKAQLEEARQRIIESDAGIFILLDQEGRGSGLLNKARAYRKLHNEEINTVEAYRELGLDIDQRTYDHAAEALQILGVESIRLLTNNPAKVEELTEAGIEVERVPLKTEPTPHNISYLKAKQEQLGHNLDIEEEINELQNESK